MKRQAPPPSDSLPPSTPPPRKFHNQTKQHPKLGGWGPEPRVPHTGLVGPIHIQTSGLSGSLSTHVKLLSQED